MAVTPGLRWDVLDRDNFTCQYCGASAPAVKLEIDHLVPRSKGGNDVIDNLVTACVACNQGKSAKDVAGDNHRFANDLKFVFEHYTSSPTEALRMVRSARADALDMLLDDFGYMWASTIFRVTRIPLVSDFEFYLLIGFEYEREHIWWALNDVAHMLEAGEIPPHIGRIFNNVWKRVRHHQEQAHA
jgi:hypothetical protein